MAFPSTLSSYTDPSPSDKLSTTPHSSIEGAQNTGLKEIQAFVGTLSSNVGTLVYDIRGAGSDGGGHVQTANKGGTGQTAYSKGDILVATSSSVITKLAVSVNDNDFLAVNSSVAAGVNWIAGVTSGQIQNFTANWAGKDSGTGSVYAIYPTPCVLSYADGQIFGFRAATANTIAAPAISVSSLVSKTIKNADGTALFGGQIAASQLALVQYNGSQSYFGLVSSFTPKATLIASSGATSSIASTTAETSIFSATVAAGTLGTNGVIEISIPATIQYATANSSVLMKLYYGTSVLASWTETTPLNIGTNLNSGKITGYVIANAATNAQLGTLEYYGFASGARASTIGANIYEYGTGTTTVDSTSAQNLKLTFQVSDVGANDKITWNGYIVKSL